VALAITDTAGSDSTNAKNEAVKLERGRFGYNVDIQLELGKGTSPYA